MEKRKLIDLFYEQSNSFAARNRVSVDAIADAQFHASMRLISDSVGVEKMMTWIEKESREFRRGLASSPSWIKRKAAAEPK